MIEKLYGNGQGVCMICNIEKGFHRVWTTDLYHVLNSKGKTLRFYAESLYSHTVFSDDDTRIPVCLCYGHALQVEDRRKYMTDY